MRNLFLIFAFSLMLFAPAFALNLEVEALSDFSTDNPPQTYKVKVVETASTPKETIKKGSIVEGKIKVTDAKRLKRDATFSFIPTTLTTPEGKVFKAKKGQVGKYKKEVNKGKVAKTVALSAGNFALKGLSTGYYAIEGMVKNEQDNRLKSSAVSVYKNSPLSYVEKGNTLLIKKGEHFFIKFKLDNEESKIGAAKRKLLKRNKAAV